MPFVSQIQNQFTLKDPDRDQHINEGQLDLDRLQGRQLNEHAATEHSGSDSAETHEHHHDTTSQDIVLFLFLCMLIGQVMK